MVLYLQKAATSTSALASANLKKYFGSLVRPQQRTNYLQHQRREVTFFRQQQQQHLQHQQLRFTKSIMESQRGSLPLSTCHYRLPKMKAWCGSTLLSPVTITATAPFQLQTKRTFAWWRVPLALMKSSKKQRMMALASLVGGSSLLGFLFGPMSVLVIGGLFGGLAWRIWRQTAKWWQYLPSPSVLNGNNFNTASLYSMIRSQVGQHRAEDNVRNLTIQRIKQWAHTDEGRATLLNDFNVEHVQDLDFLPTHARATYTSVKSSIDTQTSKESTTTQKEVDIQFLIEADQANGSGGCMVDTKAIIDGDTGNITLKNVRLSSPGWILDKYLPLDDQRKKQNYRIIEGEFKDV
ncbi:hypothetical protein BCR42DRAFT_410818 [Absidia repens]|uniref:Uncharacterized protein n=1 Tax=Absidia repens TaxID=90262 RepID=A0A1X2IPH9_9FUNG|nr:hypothetical protein BCR42DRAFT_410818 [Absidia repens]